LETAASDRARDAEVHRDPALFLRVAIESLPLGILMVNVDGIVVLTNRALERLFDYSSMELIGQSIEVLVPDGLRIAQTALAQDRGLHSPVRSIGAGHDLFGRRKDGSEIPISVEFSAVQFGDARFVMASVVDVTVQRRAHTELQISHEEQTRFEALISELGAQFVSLLPDEVDRAIVEALGRVVRALDLDRSAVFQLAEDDDFIHTHQWTRPGWASPPPRISARDRFPWQLERIRAGELVSYTSPEEVPNEVDRETLRGFGTKSGVTIPLVADGQTWGAVSFSAVRTPRIWTPDLINRLRVVALIFANVVGRKQADEAIRRTLAESAAVRDRLREENIYLREELNALTGAPAIVGHTAAFRRVLEQVRQVAATDSTVLLVGETGTGKGLLAGRIHELSARREHAMVRVNCAALSSALIENELFGTDRGSYPASESRHLGRLELANRSTVFLDEISDLPMDAQASLTRVLQDRQIQPLGSTKPVNVDVRVIAATNRNLEQRIAEGTFRDDLYYRLNVFPIQVPPLRERPEDIPLLVWRFVDEFSEHYGKAIDAVDEDGMAALQRYEWPGNARELRNVVERAVIVTTGRLLQIPLPTSQPVSTRANETLATVEKEHIANVLTACRGRIEGKNGAAARLGLTPRVLKATMKRLGLRWPPRTSLDL
jgi:PAS domain S-box-containing protein